MFKAAREIPGRASTEASKNFKPFSSQFLGGDPLLHVVSWRKKT